MSKTTFIRSLRRSSKSIPLREDYVMLFVRMVPCISFPFALVTATTANLLKPGFVCSRCVCVSVAQTQRTTAHASAFELLIVAERMVI